MHGLEKRWYGKPGLLRLLVPLEWLFRGLAARRRRAYQEGRQPVWRAEVPVLVVGNISVGGTGKTPLVVWLVEWCRAQGLNVGVISRGYGGRSARYPLPVSPKSRAEETGDEPLLVARRTGCPVVVDPDRPRAARALLENPEVDLIISDDGLQHYALARQLELAVIDGRRGLGNGHCLPVGPLREPPERLAEVDLCVVNGGGFAPAGRDSYRMHLRPGKLRPLRAGSVPAPGPGSRVHAVAGIGDPSRFFATLSDLGYRVIPHPFTDHQVYTPDHLYFGDDLPIIMTEKDAVKCDHLAPPNSWYLPVDAQLTEAFARDLRSRLAAFCPQLREKTDG